MALPHLFRVILPVSDIEAAASFYARLLRADVEEALVAAAADIDALT